MRTSVLWLLLPLRRARMQRTLSSARICFALLCCFWLLSCSDDVAAPRTSSKALGALGVPQAGPLSEHSPMAGLPSASVTVSSKFSTASPAAAPFVGSSVPPAAAPGMRMLWQNTSTGDRSIWLMNGTSWDGSYAALPQVPTVWSIAGAADFDADGNADIVWQKTTTGDRSIWFMNGNSWGGSYALLPQGSTE